MVFACLAMLFAAGFLRGFTGYGFSLAAVPMLTLMLPPVAAVPVAVILQLIVSITGLRRAIRQCDWNSMWLLAAGALVATPLGVWALTHFTDWVVLSIMAVLVLAALVVLSGVFGRTHTVPRSWAVAFGAVGGLFNGIAGMPGPPVIAFYLASPVASDRARASMIVLFAFTSLFALVSLVWAGTVDHASLLLTAEGLAPVLAGSWLGARAFRASSEKIYRTVGLVALGAIACMLIVRVAGKVTGL